MYLPGTCNFSLNHNLVKGRYKPYPALNVFLTFPNGEVQEVKIEVPFQWSLLVL